jgi:hypothetical protein
LLTRVVRSIPAEDATVPLTMNAFCADHPAYRFPFPIDGGDIKVHA